MPPQHQLHQEEQFFGDDGKFLSDFKLTMWIPSELGTLVVGLG